MRHITVCFLVSSLCVFICKVRSQYDYDYEAKNCPTSESITGGTVEYSSSGAVGSLLIYHCSDGFEPYPISQKICNADGEWEPKISRVKCEESNDYGDYEESQKNCSLEETIKGGNISYSNGGMEGSVLTYHCKAGEYPFPTAQRICEKDGQWSSLRLPDGKRAVNAVCKEILCAAQLELDNGQIWPRRQLFKVGEQQTFSCHDGFALFGSAQRNCTQWGGWTGTTPVCDDHSEDCKNPGTPAGAFRSGKRFRFGDSVRYRCLLGFDMLGPSERQCLDSREWSGVEPSCYAPYSFDSPAFVAQALGGSMSALMDVSLPEFKKKGPSFGRSLRVAEGHLNIFILLDTSGSISEDSFQQARNAIIKLVQKLDSYEVNMKFGIISYASEPIEIVSISGIGSDNLDYVLRKLHTFNHTIHGDKKGTNLASALDKVYDHLVFFKVTQRHFNETQNVIIITTDGQNNMGPDPVFRVKKIRHFLGYKTTKEDHTNEALLDVYVFAVGQRKLKHLKNIASRKQHEKHIFVLKNYKLLGSVFNLMINDSAVTKCGVAQEQAEDASKEAYTRPWHVDIVWDTKTCRGSMLTKNWVLTAAHCFIKVNLNNSLTFARASDIQINHGNGKSKAMKLIHHPQFDLKGLKDKNIKEFYDYDVTLVKTRQNISISLKARPVCLPCTKSSNRALRMDPDATCDQHKRFLLELNETLAYFIRQGKQRSDTQIHSGSKRDSCIQHAASIFNNSTASLHEVITDRFLCTGGSDVNRYQVTCKGDSGGALLLRKRMRYFQVGIVSWGTRKICDAKTGGNTDWSSDARDFHINVFSIMPWLKKHLGNDLEFLQD